MENIFILDTNVLLHDPQALFSFGPDRVYIPIEVIEEIDNFKRDMNELGRNSRTVASVLDSLRSRGKLGEGIRLENGGGLRIVCEEDGIDMPGFAANLGSAVDRRILSLAVQIQRSDEGFKPVVVSKDVNLRLRADVLDIEARDYQVEKYKDPDVYTGWHQLRRDTADVVLLQEGHPLSVPADRIFMPNEFVYLEDEEEEPTSALGMINSDCTSIVPIKSIADGAVGINALNLEQAFALSALLNDDINLVTLAGKAGTGKTLLAVAAGLHKVFAEDEYNRVLIFRPTISVGTDIGFLPGTVEEKMQPWMQPIYDALELIREQDRRAKRRVLPNDILECEEISVEPLTYIRGRSIPHQYIIIDEAQNLTPLEVKTVITRVGVGTKMILTGDPHQIDNPYVDSMSNGLTYLMDRFSSSPLAAHIGLRKGERSALAETAANLL